jgi:hypothetical protein
VRDQTGAQELLDSIRDGTVGVAADTRAIGQRGRGLLVSQGRRIAKDVGSRRP